MQFAVRAWQNITARFTSWFSPCIGTLSRAKPPEEKSGCGEPPRSRDGGASQQLCALHLPPLSDLSVEKSQAAHLCQQALANIPFLGKNFFQLFLRWSQIFILACLYYISFLLEFASSYSLHLEAG